MGVGEGGLFRLCHAMRNGLILKALPGLVRNRLLWHSTYSRCQVPTEDGQPRPNSVVRGTSRDYEGMRDRKPGRAETLAARMCMARLGGPMYLSVVHASMSPASGGTKTIRSRLS